MFIFPLSISHNLSFEKQKSIIKNKARVIKCIQLSCIHGQKVSNKTWPAIGQNTHVEKHTNKAAQRREARGTAFSTSFSSKSWTVCHEYNMHLVRSTLIHLICLLGPKLAFLTQFSALTPITIGISPTGSHAKKHLSAF